MKILLKNGNIVTDKVEKGSLLVEDGIIKDIAASIEGVQQIVDCEGKYIVPGLIDMHVHLREPGLEYKETLASGAEGAIHGGLTTICCMANTAPVIDTSSIVSWVRRRSDEIGMADILPFACVTKQMQGEELTEMGDLLQAGACGFSDDGKPVNSSEVMRRALEYSRHFGAFISAHEEDLKLANGGFIHEGKISTEYGFRGIPAESESVMVARDIEIARLTGGHVHICHVSSRHSLKMIQRAKEDGINVTAEVTHNHLTFTDELCKSYNTNTKNNPPLRAEEDRLLLLDGIKKGYIDCLVSDHAPHHKDDKFKEYDYASFGMTGLQTIVPALLKLIADGALTWQDFVRITATNPAKILKLANKGQLAKGGIADIAIIDPEQTYVYNETVNKSLSFNTPFWGQTLKGKAVQVLKGGRLML
ncbi:MAG: dihydroorotase [Deferribacteraceae bacterium]|jgi:dihydroorotase|nr:dihydroorotase [Deferribacteraceae bacterium]